MQPSHPPTYIPIISACRRQKNRGHRFEANLGSIKFKAILGYVVNPITDRHKYIVWSFAKTKPCQWPSGNILFSSAERKEKEKEGKARVCILS